MLGLTKNPALGDALTALGLGLSSYGAGNPNWGQNAILGMQNMRQNRMDNQRQTQQMDQQAQLFEFQKRKYEADMKAQADAAARQAQLRATLPPEQQPLFDLDPGKFAEKYIGQQFPDPVQPGSALAKAAADLKAGLIDQPTYDAFVRKETYIAPQQPKEPRAPNWTTFVGPDGKEVTVDGNSPDAAALVGQGYIERRSSLFPSLPSGYQPDPNNPAGLAPVPGGPADPQNPVNISDTERGAAGFADRLAAADAVISDNTAAGTSYIDTGLAAIPFLGNSVSSGGRQAYDQAVRDFVTAQLRKESGASISPGEFANAEKQYFPQPGDSKEVIEQKAAARKVAIDNMRRNAGGAATSTPVAAPDNDPLGIR